jgi:DNA-binding transcriptional MerR regulator
MTHDRLLLVGEASQLLEVHPSTLRRWGDRGNPETYEG